MIASIASAREMICIGLHLPRKQHPSIRLKLKAFILKTPFFTDH
jgi:hypothetical protein